MNVLSMFRSGQCAQPAGQRFRPQLETLESRVVPANPHFIYALSSVDAAGALVVDFKEAGLGNNENIDYELTGDNSAQFYNVNNGGNVVQGNPWNGTAVLLAEGTFSSGKNGHVTATLTSNAPSFSDSGLKQPNGNGWQTYLDVYYTNLVLTDVTNDVSIDVPDASAEGIRIH